MSVTIKKRNNEWWREPGESRILEQEEKDQASKLQEKYDPKRLHPGWSGKDAPAAEEMGSGYAKNGDGKYDKLGSSQANSEKTKKGDGQKADYPDVKEKNNKKKIRKVQEDDFGGEPMMGGGAEDMMGGGEDEGLNPEDNIPPEMEDEELEGDEAEETAEKVTIEIDGKKFELVPMEDEMEMEGEMGEEPMEPEMEEPSEAEANGGVAAEDKDVSYQERGKGKKKALKEDESALSGVPAAGGDFMGEQDYDKLLDGAIAKVQNKQENVVREKQIRKLIQMKNYAEKKLAELFTGEYVMNKQGEVGFDFSDVTGDEKFAVVARAASGDQYSPTISKSVWEPEEKGGKTAHAKKAESTKKPLDKKQRLEAFRKWITAHSTPINESDDPGQDSENFNKGDLVTVKTDISPLDGEEFVRSPEMIGALPDTISQYKKTVERRKVRQAKVLEKPVRFPSKKVEESLEKEPLNESFDYKKLLKGEYTNRQPEEEE